MENLALRWLRTTKNSLDDFDGQCMELVDEVGRWLTKKGIPHSILWIESASAPEVMWSSTIVAHYPNNEQHWGYHVVILSKGLIHDAWLRDPLPQRQYFARVFPDQRVRVEHRTSKHGDLTLTEIRRSGRTISRKHGE